MLFTFSSTVAMCVFSPEGLMLKTGCGSDLSDAPTRLACRGVRRVAVHFRIPLV
jgi:hypothetical protein